MAEIEILSLQKKSNRLKKRPIRLDLTPMVDLGFLLITFFVFTTTMSENKVMNFNEPIPGPPQPVPMSGALTIIADKNGAAYYYNGFFEESKILKTGLSELRQIISHKKKITPLSELMIIIKATEHSTFGNVIDIMDEIVIADIPDGNYAEVDMTDEERKAIK